MNHHSSKVFLLKAKCLERDTLRVSISLSCLNKHHRFTAMLYDPAHHTFPNLRSFHIESAQRHGLNLATPCNQIRQPGRGLHHDSGFTLILQILSENQTSFPAATLNHSRDEIENRHRDPPDTSLASHQHRNASREW